MRKLFFAVSLALFLLVAAATWAWPWAALSLVALVPLFAVGAHNALQTKHAVLRNFPLIGALRYFFEAIRPEIQQYFVESDIDGAPVPRETRSVIYQRAKKDTDTLPFGTQRNVYEEGYEWIAHSLAPQQPDPGSLRVLIGGPQCAKPYSASVLNVSAMSYGALSRNAVRALNGGAKLGDFYQNTGEGGLSAHHLAEGGDIVWQIGTGYFGCRDASGGFDAGLFKQKAASPAVKMIEIKLSQGAKPSHGGILPAAKVTPEIAAIRNVPLGQDVISPPAHSAFSTPRGLIKFVARLRELSGGKPIGFKLCVGSPAEFVAICKAMLEERVMPDFITVDGGEGGTGAAPLEFSNSVGAPLEEGLTLVHDVLRGFDLRRSVRVIASGKVMTGFNIFSRMALGADLCNSARGMMLALGCIQARRCNTNNCPTGVATTNEQLISGLVPSAKRARVANFQHGTVHAFADLLGAAGLRRPAEIDRTRVHRRVSIERTRTYAELFPPVEVGAFLRGEIPEKYRAIVAAAAADRFAPPSEPEQGRDEAMAV
jgi:glutamate synthase domain-containing protein 2